MPLCTPAIVVKDQVPNTFHRLAINAAYKCVDNRHRVGSLVVKGGKILSVSHNRKNRHAEIRAIAKVWRSELKGATVYVARPMYDRNRFVGMARPCPNCERVLKEVGIATIVYTNDLDGWTRERI